MKMMMMDMFNSQVRGIEERMGKMTALFIRLARLIPGSGYHKPRTAVNIMYDYHYEEKKSHFTLEIQVISRYFIFTQSHSN